MNLFKLQIKLGNDEMRTSYDVADALLKISNQIRESMCDFKVILDNNGNTVGFYKVQK